MNNQQMRKGRFISIEGLDGSGKSTQCHLLEAALREKGHVVHRIQALRPSHLRRALLENEVKNNFSEVLIFMAVFYDHILEINTLLKHDMVILTDRWYDSFKAYQGYGLKQIDLIHSLEVLLPEKVPQPDLTIFLDLPVKKMQERLIHREQKIDSIESRTSSFFNAVREGFVETAKNEPQRMIQMNAELDIETVQLLVLQNVEKLLVS